MTQLKKYFWYLLFLSLLSFLIYYIIESSILIIQISASYNKILRIVIVVENFAILLVEFLSSFYSVFIYYIIGSSTDYRKESIKDNFYLTRDPLPEVAIIVPTYNEPLNVVKKTLEEAQKIDYPKEQLKIIVADDSSAKENKLELKKFCENRKIEYVSRETRKGFKAGAINNVLSNLSSDFFAILDADHIPTTNFIKTCLSGFNDNKTIFVQTKPLFVNQDNYMQRSSAYIHSQFYQVIQKSRDKRQSVIFAGTTGIFRTKLIKEAGGFLEDTLAEDTDTSFVLISKGYKSRYLNEVCSYGLVPWTPISIISQIWRWSHGLTQIFIKRVPKILIKKGSLANKIDLVTTTITPLMGISMWVTNFLILYLNFFSGLPLIRPIVTSQNIPLFILAPLLIAIANIILGIVTWFREEKEDKMIKMRGFVGFLWTIGAFYILMLTAQSFLIWSVLSALLGVKKDFKRTAKSKPKSIGTISEKVKYSIWSFLLFLSSLPFYYAIYYCLTTNDPLLGWLIMAAISLSIPMIITLTYFKELEFIKARDANKTAADVMSKQNR